MPPKLAPPRLPPKIRKFESGVEKCRKKKKIAELIESKKLEQAHISKCNFSNRIPKIMDTGMRKGIKVVTHEEINSESL
ncbi:hypothetical protein MTR_2g094850 [Medicago truncatula]|uniref:Uncharacterized protein n=1 Tax=Medicago truncatula TaxID=3880 RepID=A0A072VBG4_MEDTR|nr:hypothetical protein MTR_2g094850 [Medicago truncatula]